MKLDISAASPEDLKFFLEWATAKRDHYASLVRDLDRALQTVAQSELRLTPDTSLPSRKSKQRTLDKIVKVMDENGGWLSNKEIRILLETKMQVRRSANGIRVHLQRNDGSIFERKGENKNTRWKLKKEQ